MSAQAAATERLLQRRLFVIATAGHVDHGKSTLVRALTGVETDTLAEEKARGLTIDLGFAYSHHTLNSSRSTTLGFIDVPGHRDFIHNMLAGVSAIDAALLVIAADDGIMPQSREHLQILDLLQVKQLVVAISKTDRCDEKRRRQVEQDVSSLLAASGLADCPIIPTSSLSKSGIEAIQACLLGMAEKTQAADSASRLFRYQIDRSFSVKGIGTVVTGSATSGRCRKDDVYCHSESGNQCRVRALRLDKQELTELNSGERAAINLANLNAEDISRGSWIVDPWLLNPVQRIDSRVTWQDEKRPAPGTQYHLYLGAAHHLVSLRELDEQQQGWMQIRSHSPMHCHFGDRFIIRDPTGRKTVAGGKVIDTHVPRKHRSSEKRLAQLQAMDNDDQQALAGLLHLEEYGVDLVAFRRNRNISSSGLDHYLEKCRDADQAVFRIGSQAVDQAFSKVHFEQCARTILAALTEFHRSHKSESGISAAALSKASGFKSHFALFKAIIQKLIELDLLEQNAAVLRLPGHIIERSPEEKLFAAEIEPLLRKGGLIPPRTLELVDATGIPLPRLEKILRQCVKIGILIKVADNRHYLPETIVELAEFTELLAGNKESGFSVIEFRDASGIGRNLCIEILEYFDHVGFTRRDGNTRFLRTEKENIFS